jgi:hypothetical protein
MRKLVVLLTLVLSASGILLVLLRQLAPEAEWVKWFSLLHTWGGNFYLVLFPLYAWDHISTNRAWLRVPALVTASGMVQTLAAALLMATGVLLLLYGSGVWPSVRLTHHWLTYVLGGALLLHTLSRKHR